MTTPVRAEQSLNASPPIFVTPAGMTIFVRAVQPANTPQPISLTRLGRVMPFRAAHRSNARAPISATSAKSISHRFPQPANAASPIATMFLPMTIFLKFLIPLRMLLNFVWTLNGFDFVTYSEPTSITSVSSALYSAIFALSFRNGQVVVGQADRIGTLRVAAEFDERPIQRIQRAPRGQSGAVETVALVQRVP